jgi:hypothetical protein
LYHGWNNGGKCLFKNTVVGWKVCLQINKKKKEGRGIFK